MPQPKICKKVAELRATMSSHLKLAKVSIWHISKTGVLITCHFVPILTWFKRKSTKSEIRTKLENFSQTLPLLCSKVFRVSFFETLISDDKKKTGHNVIVKSKIKVPKFMIYFIATEQLQYTLQISEWRGKKKRSLLAVFSVYCDNGKFPRRNCSGKRHYLRISQNEDLCFSPADISIREKSHSPEITQRCDPGYLEIQFFKLKTCKKKRNSESVEMKVEHSRK